MTKGLPTSTFSEFRSSLCVAADPSTAGGVEICTYVYRFLGSQGTRFLGFQGL
jgi:hypothetical protein